MNKFLPLLLLLLWTSLQAQMVDAIALIVNGQPVTTTEIRTIQRKAHVSKQKAINLLIQDRLQKAAMKDIVVPESEVDAEIARIAKMNNISVPKMQKILKQQGTSWTKYRQTIKDGLRQREFFRQTVSKNLPTPTEDELKLFYNKHKKEFNIPSAISVIEYSAPSEAKIKQFLKTKNAKGIKSKSLVKKTKNLNPAMLSTLLQTPNGSFTEPINAGDRWDVYKVKSKNGRTQMPFEAAKGAVASRWRQQQQGKAVKDYFKKMRTEANIQYLRN